MLVDIKVLPNGDAVSKVLLPNPKLDQVKVFLPILTVK